MLDIEQSYALFAIVWALFWLVLTIYLWKVYLPRRFKTDVLDGVIELFESENKKDREKLQKIIAYSTLYIMKAVAEDEVAKKFIKDYLNGISMSFVNIICNRFGITPDELKKLVSGAGVPTDAQGNPDFAAMVMSTMGKKLPDMIGNAIEDMFPG